MSEKDVSSRAWVLPQPDRASYAIISTEGAVLLLRGLDAIDAERGYRFLIASPSSIAIRLRTENA
jgi:hypothetical protein